MPTTIYTKTSQVTVGQLHCFEINPLGTFSTFDAPDPCTFARSNCWKPFFPPKALNFKPLHPEPSNTFVKRHLRRETPSTSKATILLPLKKSSKYFALFRRALRQTWPVESIFQLWMANINQNKGVEFRSQQIAPQECLISTLKEKGIL